MLSPSRVNDYIDTGLAEQKSHLTTHARRFYGNVSKKNGDGRRSYERFEREERPKKNTKSRGYSFLQYEKKLSQGLWEPIFIV